MMRDKFDFTDLEPDMLEYILGHIVQMAPQFGIAVELQRQLTEKVDAQIRADKGGEQQFRIRKYKDRKRLTPEQRQALYADGLTNMPTSEITTKHKISRATLYREMKKGGGRFG